MDGLAACDTGEPEAAAVTVPAAESPLSETAIEGADAKMGTIDELVEAMSALDDMLD